MSFHECGWPRKESEARQPSVTELRECGRNKSQLHPNLWWGGISGPVLCWCMGASVASMEKNNPERTGDCCRAGIKPCSSGGRATGSPTVRSKERTARTRGAELVWWAPRAVKVQDWTVNCTHISQVSLAKIQCFGFM